jgi:hypothetical protein
MNFPRREEATNKELILTIIEIQGYLARYGKSHTNWHETLNEVIERLEWIPVSERLPDDLEIVNITWINHEPEPYYHNIKDKPFVATGIYFRGKWHWFSTFCDSYLAEYGRCDFDEVDDAIEIVAWMPLPEPYRSEG